MVQMELSLPKDEFHFKNIYFAFNHFRFDLNSIFIFNITFLSIKYCL